MLGIINGIERTPDQFRELVGKAGFKLERVWECRSQVSIVELRAANMGGWNGVVESNGAHGTNGANVMSGF